MSDLLNHDIRVVDRCARVEVFSRPDLTLEQGVAAGRLLFESLGALVERRAIDTQIWDMRRAPIAGPRVRQQIRAYMRLAADHGVRTAIVAAHATHQMLYSRLLELTLGTAGAVFQSPESARAFALGEPADGLDGWIAPLVSSGGQRAIERARTETDGED